METFFLFVFCFTFCLFFVLDLACICTRIKRAVRAHSRNVPAHCVWTELLQKLQLLLKSDAVRLFICLFVHDTGEKRCK